jgi:hypothetical protein
LYACATHNFSFSISFNATSQLSFTSSILSIINSWYSPHNSASCASTLYPCRFTSIGSTTSCPKTNSNGVTLIAPCLGIQCSHKASDNTSCHLLGVSSIFFLINLGVFILAWLLISGLILFPKRSLSFLNPAHLRTCNKTYLPNFTLNTSLLFLLSWINSNLN